jgi:hypothetical protein
LPAAVYKRPTEGGLWGFWLFAFGGFTELFGLLLLGTLLWAFWCGTLLEGKRIIEGKNC